MKRIGKNLFAFSCILLICLALFISAICILDPFFHYHAPLKGFYYSLNNERSQNDGIVKHFDYNAIITGTSLTENFKTSEFDSYFQTNSIKIPYSGATYYETARSIRLAYEYGHQLTYVFRSLDLNHLIEDSNRLRMDLGEYPEYLYNDNLLDDYQYVLNKDILLTYCVPMIVNQFRGQKPGIQSFDSYCFWSGNETGKEIVLADRTDFPTPSNSIPYSEADHTMLQENVENNIISLAKEHPETTFIYYIPPYNVVWWGDLYTSGELQRTISAEQQAIEMMLECPNIELYMLTNNLELTADLNQYKDSIHYMDHTNSTILLDVSNGVGLLTKDNYLAMLEEQKRLYFNYDFNSLFE